MEESYLLQLIPGLFLSGPNQAILSRRIDELNNKSTLYSYHYFSGISKVNCDSLLTFGNEEFFKVKYYNSLLVLKDINDIDIVQLIKDFEIEIYISLNDEFGHYRNPRLFGMDELVFYLEYKLNRIAKEKEGFPRHNFDNTFIVEGRKLINAYYPKYKGNVFNNGHFELEVRELFTIAENSLAFLLRFKLRIEYEFEVATNINYSDEIKVYPRFLNTIAETANYIYNIWERITYLLNEFFPINVGKARSPSFKQYIEKVGKILPVELKTENFEWFSDRLKNEHPILEEIRHSLVHYNQTRKIIGVRSAHFVRKSYLNNKFEVDFLEVSEDINFLISELKMANVGISKALLVLNDWALNKKLNIG